MANQPSGSDAPGPSGATRPAQGDDALPGAPGVGENLCPQCNGSGKLGNRPCPNCDGTGKVIDGIGGG